jgi:hypothetical protein
VAVYLEIIQTLSKKESEVIIRRVCLQFSSVGVPDGHAIAVLAENGAVTGSSNNYSRKTGVNSFLSCKIGGGVELSVTYHIFVD